MWIKLTNGWQSWTSVKLTTKFILDFKKKHSFYYLLILYITLPQFFVYFFQFKEELNPTEQGLRRKAGGKKAIF